MKLIIGTAQFGSNYGIANNTGKIVAKEAHNILKVANEKGIKSIDTAVDYGESSKVIGSYIKNNNDSNFNIITKIRKNDSAIEQIKITIDTLGITPHAVLSHKISDYYDNKFYEELLELKSLGYTKKIGVSIYAEDNLKQLFENHVPDLVQLPLNILDTRLHKNGTIARLKERKIEIHARSIFFQGVFFLSDKLLRENFSDALKPINYLKSISRNASVSLSELSLLWVNSLKQIDGIVIGVDNLNHLNINLNSIEREIDPSYFKRALEVSYDNENILNPTYWTT